MRLRAGYLATIAVGAALVAVVIGMALEGPAPAGRGVTQPTAPGQQVTRNCSTTGATKLSSGSYWYCDVTLNWTGWLPNVTELANVTFHGVLFNVSGYDTMECPVLQVTGYETGGPSYSFLIYATPLNCNYTHPTVLAPDGLFGASWNGEPVVQLLVRAS